MRPASPADATTLARLNTIVQRLHHDALPGRFKAPDPGATVGFHDDWLGRPETVSFLAEQDDGRPVGYVLAAVARREETALVSAGTVMYVHQIAVEPAETEHGWGTALMRAVEDEAVRRGLGEVGLDYWSFNDRARRFFAGLGYEPYNVRAAKKLDR